MENRGINLKVENMNESSRNVNAILKVVEVGETKDIRSRLGDRRVSEVKVADETGCVLLSLWDDQIGKIAAGDTISVENGYISVVRNSLRLNIGKYGKMLISEEDIGEVNTKNNISERYVEQKPRQFREYGAGAGRPRGYEPSRGRGRERRGRGRR